MKAIVVDIEKSGEGFQVSIDHVIREGARSIPTRYLESKEEVNEYVRQIRKEYEKLGYRVGVQDET